MPFGTITATESTFGSISGSIVGAVPGTLSGSVGVPGPQGQQGIQGPPGPVGPAGPGSTWGGIAGTISDQTDLWTQLGLKAPLAGPVFTGDARAVTPTFGDNDTSIATTAFVQSALLGGTAIARNLEVEVRNQSGVTVPAGSIVYISGATGNKPLITLAQANNDANSAQTIGFVKTAIANNGTGYVIVRGELENIDTSALAEGVQLYLSPTTAGTWTTTKPSAPQHLVYVGICVRSHPTLGTILVAVQNGYELDELHDVQIVSPTNGQVLKYNSTSGLWVNGTDVAPVTSVAGRTGAITLSNTDISGLGTMATASASNYSTTAVADTLYAPIARGLPASGTVGQMLTKQSGTSYDAAWQTLIPGDRYVTTSSTSLTIGTGTKSLTIGTGLAYTPNQDVTVSLSSDPTLHHMHGPVTSYNSGTGALVMEVQSFEGSGTYSSWVVNVGGTVPLQTVEWGEVTGILGDQTDLATALNAKLEITDAASTYYLQTNPAGYITSSALTGYATESWVTSQAYATESWVDLQGYLTAIPAGYALESWVTAGFYPLTGNPSGFITSSSLSGYALLSGATFTGLISTPAATTASAFLRLPHGTAPTTPVNGDLWTTTSGLFARINGTTQQYVDLGGTQTISGNKTFSNASLTLGNSTAAGTLNLGTGATVSGSTRTINIGTASAAGSTNAINIGGGSGTTTTTFNGNIGGTFTRTGGKTIFAAPAAGYASVNFTPGSAPTTLAAGDLWYDSLTNKLVLRATFNDPVATEAYISGLASNATPLVNGTGSSGSSTNFSRNDHVHPTDTSRAATASPTFTGTPLSTTAAADTNTTQIATTAFVVGQAGSATPLVDGTAAVGTSLRYARQDHVHPTDTSRAATASPTFTGTPTAPTASPGTNTTQLATTAFVTAAVPSLATFAQSIPTTLDTTRAVTPAGMMFNRMYGGFIDVPRIGMNYVTSGTGAQMFLNGHLGSLYLLASTANTSNARGRIFGSSQADEQLQYLRKDSVTQNQGYNFSNMMWLSGRIAFVNRDANVVIRVTLGKADAAGVGDLASKGIGVRKVGSTGAIQLTVHNGTTLTNVSSSTTAEGVYDIDVISLGDGNVNLYIDRVLAATTSSGPTGNTSVTTPTYQEEIESTAIPTIGNGYVVCTRMKYYSS